MKNNIWIDGACAVCHKKCRYNKYKAKSMKRIVCSIGCGHTYNYYTKNPKVAAIMNNTDDLNFYYLIGLIVTDGHIWWPNCTKGQTNYGISIELHLKDKQLLDNLVDIFGGNLSSPTKASCIKWTIHNRAFVEYLRDIIGLTNNKSLTLTIKDTWFYNLSVEQRNRFLHGVIDGDGCVCIKGSRYVSICSYASNFRNMLVEHLSKNNIPVHINKPQTEISLRGRYAAIVFKDIIVNTSGYIHLSRKYNNFKELYNHYAGAKPYRGVKI